MLFFAIIMYAGMFVGQVRKLHEVRIQSQEARKDLKFLVSFSKFLSRNFFMSLTNLPGNKQPPGGLKLSLTPYETVLS